MKAGRIFWGALLVLLVAFLAVTFGDNLLGGVGVGEPLPQTILTGLDGSERTLDAWRGRALVVRFSSAACTYCSRDFGVLDALQEGLGERVQVLAVQVGDTAEGVRGALMGADPKVPVLLDPQGELARSLGIRSLPAVAFVTARGTLSSLVNREIAQTDVEPHIQTAVMGGPDLQDDLRRVARQLRCRECEGRSVWESDARSSIEMREEIQRRLLAGERPDQLVQSFREAYGDWILMAPPVAGIGSLAWFLPAGGLVAGVLAWAGYLRRRRRKPGAPEAEHAGPDDKSRLKRRIKDYM